MAKSAGSGLSVHALPKDAQATYNPEWTPEGFEGGVDTHSLPWIPHPHMPGCFLKTLRVSRETGHFTILNKVPKGTVLPPHTLLGTQDLFIISGKLVNTQGPAKGELGPGVWTYLPAGVKVVGTKALEDTETLMTCYGPMNFEKGSLSGLDIQAIADKHGIPLLPLTLAEQMGPPPKKYSGKGDPLAMTDPKIARLASHAERPVVTELANPHIVDTNAIPWIVDPAAPEIGIKVVRVSHETGNTAVMVRQNGQAPPHYHLGASDFFILSGRIAYRAGPPAGFGPGSYFWEPAGARHEATQRLPGETEDLIYTANLYGPIQFDGGLGTPVLAVQSWMQYLAAAEASKTPLIANTLTSKL